MNTVQNMKQRFESKQCMIHQCFGESTLFAQVLEKVILFSCTCSVSDGNIHLVPICGMVYPLLVCLHCVLGITSVQEEQSVVKGTCGGHPPPHIGHGIEIFFRVIDTCTKLITERVLA